MNSPSNDPLEACARAIASVAGLPGLHDAVGEAPGLADEPAPDVDGAPPAATPRRGRADAFALHRAFHDADLHRELSPPERIAGELFTLLERERVQALGANRWAGVRINLDGLRQREQAAGRSPAVGGREAVSGDGLESALERVAKGVRQVISAADVTARPTAPVAPLAMSSVEARVAVLLEELAVEFRATIDDQAGFARVAKSLVRRLGLRDAAGDPAGEPLDGDAPEPVVDGHAEDGDDEATDDAANDDSTMDDSEDAESTQGDEDTKPPAIAGDEDVTAALAKAEDEPPIAGVDPRQVAPGASSGYRVFTREFDETVNASELTAVAILDARRAELDRHLSRQGRLVRRLATRLQRVLLARQRREWQFDLDEGQLDTRRLTRLVTEPLSPLVYKSEVESAFRDTTVTLLIDNSRSMIGRPIMIAAACADILAETLERCGVGVEVLGFTTVELHGGRATAAWEAAGSPADPGRLNDVRHIIYKSADVPYRSARRQLALMLERDILKQNVDGEALQWAASRLLRRPSERRILMVISDGAPVDTSTLTHNPRDYLDRHLDAVIESVERRATIELVAIGIGHDVARFYSQAMSVFDARDLGPALLSRLESLFRRDA